MSFDNKDYPNRKDHRKPYPHKGPRRFAASCRPGGSCKFCTHGRCHSQIRDERDADDQIEEFHNFDATEEQAWLDDEAMWRDMEDDPNWP
jgi:hypothetical protein